MLRGKLICEDAIDELRDKFEESELLADEQEREEVEEKLRKIWQMN